MRSALSLYVHTCKMDANGVTPIPVPMRTACSERKMSEAGAPKGPSTWISSGFSSLAFLPGLHQDQDRFKTFF